MKTPAIISFPESSYTKRLLLTVAGMVFAALALLVISPTVLWALMIGPDTFFTKPVHTLRSPDNKYDIVVSRRVNFPVFDPSSPSITAIVHLKNAGDWREIKYVEFGIHEYSELMAPELTWTHVDVKIDKIDYYNEYAFTFRFPKPSE